MMTGMDTDLQKLPFPEYRKYPFPTMAVGEMFHVEPGDVAHVRWAASKYGKRHGMAFAVRQYKGGTGCWRVE